MQAHPFAAIGMDLAAARLAFKRTAARNAKVRPQIQRIGLPGGAISAASSGCAAATKTSLLKSSSTAGSAAATPSSTQPATLRLCYAALYVFAWNLPPVT
jgi:hypothetical protein